MADGAKTMIDASSHIHAIFPNAEVETTGVPVTIDARTAGIPTDVYRSFVMIVRLC